MEGFRKNHTMYKIRGKVVFDTPLRIGTSNKSPTYSVASAPVFLTYDSEKEEYYPMIPGSSMKGLLRSSAERILRTIGNPVCSLTKKGKGCGDCIACKLFGSMKMASHVKVHDCIPLESIRTGERPHYSNLRRARLRIEEEIHPGEFSFSVDVQNVEKSELGVVFMAINEFYHRRSFIGGGSTRGYGVADVDIDRIRIITDPLFDKGTDIIGEETDGFITESINDAFSTLIDKKRIVPIENGFLIFNHADNHNIEGCVSMEFKVNTTTKFQMSGVDERTVTVDGTPVIPGSTIKGFLRNHFEKNGKSRAWLNDIFGSLQRRSRIVISDAFPEGKIVGDQIDPGTELTCYMTFDNMEKKDIISIIDGHTGFS